MQYCSTETVSVNIPLPPDQYHIADMEQEVKVIWQKAPHGGPIPRLGVTPGGRKLYHWIPGVGFPISVLSEEVRTHNSTPPWTTLVTSSGENSVSVMCSGASLSQWHCTFIPRWDPSEVCWRWCTSATPICCHVDTGRAANATRTLGDRAFPVAAARAWNALPLSVRAVSSLLLFRRELKTTLFRACYAWRLRYSCY